MEKDLIKLNKEGWDEPILKEALKLKECIIKARRGTSKPYYYYIDNSNFYNFAFDSVQDCLRDGCGSIKHWIFASETVEETVEEICRAGFHDFQIISYVGETEEMGQCRIWLNNN